MIPNGSATPDRKLSRNLQTQKCPLRPVTLVLKFFIIIKCWEDRGRNPCLMARGQDDRGRSRRLMAKSARCAACDRAAATCQRSRNGFDQNRSRACTRPVPRQKCGAGAEAAWELWTRSRGGRAAGRRGEAGLRRGETALQASKGCTPTVCRRCRSAQHLSEVCADDYDCAVY